MRIHVRALQAGAMLIGGILLIATVVRSQAPGGSSGQVWEYSSVSGRPISNQTTGTPGKYQYVSSATICYASPMDCRIETITTTVASPNGGGRALMMATAKLGEDGWELTAATEARGDANDRVLYFRRLRSSAH